MKKNKVVLITGASTGIGFEAARMLAERGHVVYAAARHIEPIEKLSGLGVKALCMDVTDDDAVLAGVARVLNEQGRIDVLVNNAGYGSFGPVEEVTLAEARRQIDVNIYGCVRLIKAVLPQMRAQGAGTIVNTSSMGARFTTYFGAWYHATKYALSSLSDALRMELQPFGIHVSIIEPGIIRTPWGEIAAGNLRKTVADTPYESAGNKAADMLTHWYTSRLLSPPRVIARCIVRAAEARRPRTRYRRGRGTRILPLLHSILPTRCFDALMRKL